MAQFTSTRYPGLILQDDKGIWAQFVDGTFETTAAPVIKRLKALPQEYGVSETSDPAQGPTEPPSE